MDVQIRQTARKIVIRQYVATVGPIGQDTPHIGAFLVPVVFCYCQPLPSMERTPDMAHVVTERIVLRSGVPLG